MRTGLRPTGSDGICTKIQSQQLQLAIPRTAQPPLIRDSSVNMKSAKLSNDLSSMVWWPFPGRCEHFFVTWIELLHEPAPELVRESKSLRFVDWKCSRYAFTSSCSTWWATCIVDFCRITSVASENAQFMMASMGTQVSFTISQRQCEMCHSCRITCIENVKMCIHPHDSSYGSPCLFIDQPSYSLSSTSSYQLRASVFL